MEQNIYSSSKGPFFRALLINANPRFTMKLAKMLIVGVLLLFGGLANAQTPVIIDLELLAASPENLSIDSLHTEFWYTVGAVETASAWYRDGEPEAIMLLPFEAGETNALLDFSGNNNDASTGPPNSRPTFSTTAGYNGTGAFIFDGDDYLSVGEIFPVNSSYTKTAWINLSLAGAGETCVIMGSAENASNNHFLKVDPNGSINAGHNNGTPIVDIGDSINSNEWYFIGLTFDYASGEMILYRNGNEEDRAIVPVADRSIAHPSVMIGEMNNNWGWMGTLDEPVIYDHVVSPEQMWSLSHAGNSVIDAAETRGGEEWYAVVTPFSATEVGITSVTNTIHVRSVVVSDIPDETVLEGAPFSTFDLDDFVASYDFPISELDWTTSGGVALDIEIAPGTNIVTVSPVDENWFGAEGVSFIATNPNSDGDTALVTFTVTGVNDAPEITEVGNQTMNEDETLSLAVTFVDNDPSDSHTITVESDEVNVVVQNLSGDISGSTYDLVPTTDWIGTAQITVTVTDDGDGTLSDTEIYTLTVSSANDAPEIVEVGDQSIDEDGTLSLAVTFTDLDPSDTHSITVESDDANVVVENLSGDISGSTYDLVPAANWSGTAQITVTVTDDGTIVLSDVETYTLTVNAVNDAPVITENGDETVDEDNSLVGVSVVFTDVDLTDSHVITVVSSDPNVTAENISGNVSGSTYDLVPAADWNGSTQITVSVTDDGSGTLSDFETYTLTVNAINDAPEIVESGDQIIVEDAALGQIVIFNDPEASDTHVITVVSNETNVIIANLGSGNVSGTTYSLVPAPDWFGTAQITVTVTQVGSALFDSETYTLTVTSINDMPESIALSNSTVDERVDTATVVGLFSTIDVDVSDVHQYELISDGGVLDVDNDAFVIVGDTLKTKAEIDYESQSSYSIVVQSDDGNGGTISHNFIITVNDLDETSVKDIYDNLNFNLYPVPAVDYLTVEIDNPENKELLMEIFSVSGRMVHSEMIFEKKTIELDEFTDGMYILKIRGEDVYGTRKFIIKDR